MSQGKVVKVSGPLVIASGMEEANMYDVVHVGEQGLILFFRVKCGENCNYMVAILRGKATK